MPPGQRARSAHLHASLSFFEKHSARVLHFVVLLVTDYDAAQLFIIIWKASASLMGPQATQHSD